MLRPLVPFTLRLMNIVQRAAQRFNFPLVSEFLALGQFDEFEHFLHLVERLFERFDNLRHLFNRLTDGGRRSFGFSFGQWRHIGLRAGLGNWFCSSRAAATAATVAPPPPTARATRRRGVIWFNLWFLRHFRFEHEAPPDKSNGEL